MTCNYTVQPLCKIVIKPGTLADGFASTGKIAIETKIIFLHKAVNMFISAVKFAILIRVFQRFDFLSEQTSNSDPRKCSHWHYVSTTAVFSALEVADSQ